MRYDFFDVNDWCDRPLLFEVLWSNGDSCVLDIEIAYRQAEQVLKDDRPRFGLWSMRNISAVLPLPIVELVIGFQPYCVLTPIFHHF
jgi:hypothetical protein